MSDVSLAQFQQAAVRHIVSRFRDPKGSRRMLLADEVGLGKTVVAQGVIQALLNGRQQLKVVYLCSNAEIAEQNRTKLDPESEKPIGRVTQLALERGGSNRDLLLYSFTSGTSLKGGTGLEWERRLLLYLVYRIYGLPVWKVRWREFFRCGAGPVNWQDRTRFSQLTEDFQRKTTAEFQGALAEKWRGADFEGTKVRQALEVAVEAFDVDKPKLRHDRNRLIAFLRGGMQRIALTHIRPDLVILDEVQRFRDVLEEADNSEHIASTLLSSDVPVLILSATPYRALTLGHELSEGISSHHEDFFSTLAFLFRTDTETPSRIRRNLDAFGAHLTRPEVVSELDPQLVSLKRQLETDLTKVICRTERNWYVLDRRKGIDDQPVGCDEMPRRDELQEFFHLHKTLNPLGVGVGQVTEFWKSAPSMLSFVDAQYHVFRTLEDRQARVPSELLTPAEEMAGLATRNRRIRSVVDVAIGEGEIEPTLWIAPTYTYYENDYFKRRQPRKMLVFSGWRFVPKTVAILASAAASDRLKLDHEEASKQPIRFTEKWSWHVFDLCLPSPALAAIGDKAFREAVNAGNASAEDVISRTERILREELLKAKVSVVATGGHRAWEVVMRLESAAGYGERIKASLEKAVDQEEEGAAEHLERHKRELASWLRHDAAGLEISEGRIRRLSLVAAFSPALALFRACESVYGEAAALDSLADMTAVCMGAMRRYFNRPIVQRVIRQHRFRLAWRQMPVEDRGYAERALVYAADAHLQAVFDEFVYLLRHAAQAESVDKALNKLKDIWTLSQGSPRTNRAKGSGRLVRISESADVHATHFALAFGEDVSKDAAPDEAEDDARMRKSVVREAFNSPFWPFVLATTSVGQEGLDFHLYCRDILHWNLPSNPVDLEQREGRINRRDCLAIRASIARDWPHVEAPLATRVEAQRNPWPTLFDRIDRGAGDQRYKHGLFPHWVYECKDPDQTVRIKRHVPFFSASRDAAKYGRLKTGLALYRLVFGQVNQGDLLERLREQADALGPEAKDARLRRLASYMLNLSPIGRDAAMELARSEALTLAKQGPQSSGTCDLIAAVRRLVAGSPNVLSVVAAEVECLINVVKSATEPGKLKSAHALKVLAALAYLRNPYDQIFDLQVEGGYIDDIEVIREAWQAVASLDVLSEKIA
jgi:hypothetical protein